MQIKFDNRSPVYVQVIQYFKEEIASGRLAMGAEIPSRRELANVLKINPNTVQRAYKEMEEAGLIYTEGNLPSKVTSDVNVIQSTKNELVAEALDEFIRTVHSIAVPLDDLITFIKERYEQEEREGQA